MRLERLKAARRRRLSDGAGHGAGHGGRRQAGGPGSGGPGGGRAFSRLVRCVKAFWYSWPSMSSRYCARYAAYRKLFAFAKPDLAQSFSTSSQSPSRIARRMRFTCVRWLTCSSSLTLVSSWIVIDEAV